MKLARPNKFQIMELFKSDIREELRQKEKVILTENDLFEILNENRLSWKLPFSATIEDFINFLINATYLELIELEFPSNKIKRYVLTEKEPTIYEIACSIHEKAYISHYTAAFYHGLTDNIVKTIYINQEQSLKSQDEWVPTQESIDKSFSKPMRITNRKTLYKEQLIYWLNGKNTAQLGIIEENNIRLTNIERTLIDIAVRPQYGGGIDEILTMYKNALESISVNKLYSYLKKLNHAYPYHQSIGFYLERAGCKESTLKLLERFPINLDFYLDYDLKDTCYSKRWKVYYPSYLD